MTRESEEEHLQQTKQNRCNHLIKALLNTDKKDTERKTKILTELTELKCEIDWSILQ